MLCSDSVIDTILFDLDGTLIDTEPTAADAVRECFTDWGMDLNPRDATFVTGRTWSSALDYLFRKYPPPIPEEQAIRRIMDHYREKLETDLVIVPGSVEAVKSLAGHFPLALVSGSSRKDILWALQKLGILEHFEVILGAEDYAQSKPEPDGYKKAMTLLGKAPEHGLVFEDSLAGITSARNAGLWVVAITETNHFNQDTSFAHAHIRNLKPVNPEWIAKLAEKLHELRPTSKLM